MTGVGVPDRLSSPAVLGTVWDQPRVGEIGGDLLEGCGEVAGARLVEEGLRVAGDVLHRLQIGELWVLSGHAVPFEPYAIA